MPRITLIIADELFREAATRATSANLSLEEVVRELLERWVDGDEVLTRDGIARSAMVADTRRSFGIWRDRDPDAILRESRACGTLQRLARSLRGAASDWADGRSVVDELIEERRREAEEE